jgi:hypothetical protein
MTLSIFILYSVIFGIGVLIGINLRNHYAEEKEKRTFAQVDEEVRNRLSVAEELNRSLLSDLAYAKKKLLASSKSTTTGNESAYGTQSVPQVSFEGAFANVGK